MKFPKYVNSADGKRTVSVVGWLDIDKEGKLIGHYTNEKAYIDHTTGDVWIYAIKEPINKDQYPYFWQDKKGVHFSEPSYTAQSVFKEDKLRDLSTDVIINSTTPGEELYNEQVINDLNASTAVFVPVIKEKDDFLKKVVKQAIIDKNIDISRLKYKMNEKYVLPNMKAALQNDTKMSTSYFVTWCEILGLDFTVVIEDNGTDPQDALIKPLFYVSNKDVVTTEENL